MHACRLLITLLGGSLFGMRMTKHAEPQGTPKAVPKLSFYEKRVKMKVSVLAGLPRS